MDAGHVPGKTNSRLLYAILPNKNIGKIIPTNCNPPRPVAGKIIAAKTAGKIPCWENTKLPR